MVELGVGKNMVRSIRHWALATNVIEEIPGSRGTELRPSALGILLLQDGGVIRTSKTLIRSGCPTGD